MCVIVAHMKSVSHENLGIFIAVLRKGLGWTQPEFAARAGVSQQTVSRWEQGASRPRFKELPGLAALLHIELSDLEAAAGYGREGETQTGLVDGPTFDVALPLYTLRPEVFENFCMDLLARHYRAQGARVNRYGGTGSKQEGIDIEVRCDSFVHTFQCKQVKEFGEKKVRAAVDAHEFEANLNVLLLSNTASPGARKAILQHARWQLWDKVDISAKFRELAMVDRRDLVDIYFPGQRRELLGELEAGPFQSPEEFFKAFILPERHFNHAWSLVGRELELKELLSHIEEEATVGTLLLGAPGNGKTRLLREVITKLKERRPEFAVWFASTTEDVKLEHLAKLGQGRKLIVVDDAHDREDLGQLFRYAGNPDNDARLLLALRPYGRTMVQSNAALAAVDVRQLATVELRVRSKSDARDLAAKVLQACEGPVQAAQDIADLTYSTPLVTVLAAQLVAREGIPVGMLGNSMDFQRVVLSRLQGIIAGEIVSATDAPKLQAVLRMVALLQPVVFDDSGFLNLLREVEGLEHEDVNRMLRVLSEGGVLFKRGLRYRIAPDLLADDLLQNNFIDFQGAVTPKVQRAFKAADAQYLKNLLVNLARLDWRLKQGSTDDSVLLKSIAAQLQWQNEYHSPHVAAMEAVAYYQPRLALDFAERLIEEGHGASPGVCQMARNAAYNFDYLRDACILLWKAGKDDERALNQNPDHGIRLLKELGEFAPFKPVEYVEEVVRFCLDLLERPSTLNAAHTPFEILEGALRTDMEDMSSDGTTVTLNRYRLDFRSAKEIRDRVIDAIVVCLRSTSNRKAFLAAALLSEALSSPMHSEDGDDVQAWSDSHVLVLQRVKDVLVEDDPHPAVLMRVAQSVSWHALYNDKSPAQPIAKAIFSLLDRNLETRVTRLVVDAWGSDTWEDDETFERKSHRADLISTTADLSNAFTAASDLYGFLNKHLKSLREIAGAGWTNPHVLIASLLQLRPDLARRVLALHSDVEAALSPYAGTALAVLMSQSADRDVVSQVLNESPSAWELVSEAYARQTEDVYRDGDLAAIRRIFTSTNETVLLNASTIARKVALHNPILAVELIASADFSVSSMATRDFLMSMANGRTIPTKIIGKAMWKKLLDKFKSLPELDDHWGQAFLRKAVAAQPKFVIEMLKARLVSGNMRYGLRLLRRDRTGNGLELLKHPEGISLLRELLEWAVAQQERGDVSSSIGSFVSGLCGKYDSSVRELLLSMLTAGKTAGAGVVASVLATVHQEFVIEHDLFVREALNRAELIGDEAVRDISSALWSATISGGRMGTVGEPFKQDLRLRAHCEVLLKGMNKLDPAHSLYSGLLHYAQESIDRQAKEKLKLQQESEDEC